MIIDHMGFFRQPPAGGLLGEAASNDEAAWAGLLSLAKYPQVAALCDDDACATRDQHMHAKS